MALGVVAGRPCRVLYLLHRRWRIHHTQRLELHALLVVLLLVQDLGSLCAQILVVVVALVVALFTQVPTRLSAADV